MSRARTAIQAPVIAVFVVITGSLPAIPPSATVKLEVTQGMQYVDHANGTNSIPLVAGRTAVVRAQVEIADPPDAVPVETVTAQLKVTPVPSTASPATLPTTSPPLNSTPFKKNLNKMVKGTTTFARRFANHTLNFEVQDIVEGKWKFTVEFECKFENGEIARGKGRAKLNAKAARPVSIRLVPMRFVDDDDNIYGPPDTADHTDAEWMVKACYPFSDDVDIQWHGAVDLPTQDRAFIGTIDDKDGADGQSDVDEVLSGLESMWQSTISAGDAHPDLFYYGLVEPDWLDHTLITDEGNRMIYGWGLCPVGFGTALPEMSAKVFAHELGHAFDLQHCGDCGPDPCGVDGQVGWDVYDGPGTSAQSNRVSFMTCGEPSKKVWITPENYKKCVEFLDDAKPAGLSTGGRVTDAPTERALVVHGSLTSDGKKIAWLRPMFRYPWRLPPRPAISKGPYEIRAASADGSVVASRRFTGRVRVERRDRSVELRHGYFSVVLPFPKDVEVETVTIRKDQTILRKVTRPPERPELEVVSPQPSATIDKPTMIRWKVKTAAKKLLFQLAYSPDGGESFRPVAVNLAKLETRFDPKRLSKTGNGLLRVIVSDGLNTTYRDVRLLNVSPY